MLDVRYGGADGLLRNEKMYSLINEANGSGGGVAVLNPAYTRLAMKATGATNPAIPGSGKAGDTDAEPDFEHPGQRRNRWKVSGDLRFDR